MGFKLPEQSLRRGLKLIYMLSIIASLVLMIDINLIDIPNIRNNTKITDTRVSFWISIYFLIDLIVLFLFSDNKWQFVLHYGILFLISIPYVSIILYFKWDLPMQLLYLLKLLPLLRGMVAFILLIRLVISNRITGLFISYLTLFITLFYFQTLIFFTFEVGVNKEVVNYGDALWWASMSATTLGSNIVPVTIFGKVATIILAVTGITLFPVFTVYITSLVQNLNKITNKHDTHPKS